MNNVGLKQNIEHLKKEYERFKRAGNSGYFCDGKKCIDTACIIKSTIEHITRLAEGCKMQDFNWEEFKNNKIAVHCNNKKELKNFITMFYSNYMDWYDSSLEEILDFLCENNYDSSRYFDFDSTGIRWDNKMFYIDRGYKIIEWE